MKKKYYALALSILVALTCVLAETVHAQMTVVINPSQHQYIDLGQNVTFTSSVNGGVPPYTYQWHQNGGPVGGNSSSWICKPNSTGNYNIYLSVRDHNSNNVSSAVTPVTVNPPLSLTISPSTATMDVNQSLTFTETVKNGTPPYTYQWSVNNNNKPGNSSSFAFTPRSAGTYNVSCAVYDGSTVLYNPPHSTASVGVNTDPTVGILPSSSAFDIGQSQAFTSTASGGTPPYTYQWCLNNAAVSGATSPNWTFVPSSSGSYSVYVNLTDHVAFRVKSNVATVTVNALASVSTSPYNITWAVNHTYTFTESVTGGTAPYTYYWGHGVNATMAYTDMGHNGPTTSNRWTFNFTAVGSWIVICNVFDSARGPPVFGPWGSTAYVNVIQGWILTLTANDTSVPHLAFKVNGTTYNGAPVTLALAQANYTITVSPTHYTIRIGRLYWITWTFVGWSNGTDPSTIISTSPTITIRLNKDTTLIANYYITSNDGEQ